MDEFLKSTYCSLFKYWILGQKIKSCSIVLKDDHHIILQSSKCQGEIFFQPMDIVELKIRNLIHHKDEFYLHFQMNNLKHAIQLFHEMKECIEQLENRKSIKVLLSCSGGMTTSYFAELLNEASQILNLDIHVEAVAYSQIYNVIDNYDIVFLAPQISYLLSNVKQYSKTVLAFSIPSQIFAKYDTKAFIDLIINEISKKKVAEKVTVHIKRKAKKQKSILCLSIFRDKKRIHILYRYYDQYQNLILDNEIIKLKISIQDISDIIRYVIASYQNLDIIAISTPGFITKKGMLVSTYLNGLDNCYIYDLLHKDFKQDIYVYNDVNSAAAGYYASQKQYENLAFIFQPVNHYPGAGIIVNGQLIKGHANLAGEIQYASRHLVKEYFSSNKTSQEILDILVNDILTIVSVVDSEIILIYTELIDQINELKRELLKVLPSDTLPTIQKIKSINEYILIGLFHLCLG